VPINYFNSIENVRSYPYPYAVSRPSIYMQVLIDINQDLVVDSMSNQKIFNIVVACGGVFTVCYCIIRYFAWLWMPWFTYLSVIVRLFKIDASKGRMPRDPTAVDKTNNEDLVAQCKERVKSRVKMNHNCCDIKVLSFEALITKMFTCRPSKFGRILEQGTAMIRRELNLFKFLKKMREIEATLYSITTFEQRRLI